MIGYVTRPRNVEHDFGCMSHFGFDGVKCDTVHGEMGHSQTNGSAGLMSQSGTFLFQHSFIPASNSFLGRLCLVGRCGTISFRTDIKILRSILFFFLFYSPRPSL